MTHIIYKLPEAWDNNVENIEYKLDDDIDLLAIERIRDKLLVKYSQINVQSEMNNSREDENIFM